MRLQARLFLLATSVAAFLAIMLALGVRDARATSRPDFVRVLGTTCPAGTVALWRDTHAPTPVTVCGNI